MVYELRKDGKILYEGTENQCLAFLHRYQPHSWKYAFEYGGYSLAPKNKNQK